MDERSRAQDAEAPVAAEGGEAACWLHLICPACGAVVGGDDGHRPGCDAHPPATPAGPSG